MVLVRKNELACRNHWDQDLWEAVAPGEAPRAPITSPEVPSLATDDSGFLPALTARQPDDRLRGGDLHTDKVTSISMPLRPLRPRADQPVVTAAVEPEPADPLPPSHSPSVREARRRRQEQKTLELRKQHERFVSDASRLLEDDVVDLPVRQPEPVSEPPRARERAGEPPVDRAPLVTRPPREEPVPSPPPPSPPRERRAPRWPVAQPSLSPTDPGNSVRFASEPDSFERSPAPSRPAPAAPEERPLPARAAAPRVRPPVPERRHQEQQTEELPKLEPAAVSGAALPPAAPPVPRSRAVAERPVPPAPMSLPLEPAVPDRNPRWVPPAGSVPIAAPLVIADEQRPYPVDPVDACGWLQSVPRCCGTCRDFKRVGDGERGWCTNRYAFGEERMVESESLACRSSMGVLWLPHDDLWLERADTTHHGRPTPLLDQIVQEGHLAGVSELEPRST